MPSRCACRWRSAITSTSIRRSNTRRILGSSFVPNAEALLPNWRWLPVGYHGRSSTIVIDGTPIRRPSGQRKAPADAAPEFGPSRRLDIELEIGFVTGPGNVLGTPIAVRDAREHIFGLLLVNDWSARDIQAWEYQPLGPFLGKSFATTISPWIVTLDALEPFRVQGPVQEPQPLSYLRADERWAYAISLAVDLQTQQMGERGIAPATISQTTFAGMYWNVAQQLAHATVNGARHAPRRSLCLGNDQRLRAGKPGKFDRADLERRAPDRTCRRREPSLLRGWRRNHAARLVRKARARGGSASARARGRIEPAYELSRALRSTSGSSSGPRTQRPLPRAAAA